jgi:hypothetical protein
MASVTEGVPPSHTGEKWQEANDYVGKDLPQIRRKIESAIRVELGEEKPTE